MYLVFYNICIWCHQYMIKNTAFHTQGEYGNQNTTAMVANITIKMYTTQTKNTNIKIVA